MGIGAKLKAHFTESKEDREARVAEKLRPMNARMDRMNAKQDNADRAAGKPVGAREYFLLENFAGITYTDTTIQLGDDVRPLAGVTVEVEASGSINRRVTATRLVAGGIVGGLLFRKKQDDRDIVMLVDGPEFQWLLPIHPKGIAAARSYATRVNTAARTMSAA